MDISQIMKLKKGPKPEPEAAPEASAAPPAAPPSSAPAPETKPELKSERPEGGFAPVPDRAPSRYQMHRDVPTVEDMDKARGVYAELVAANRAFLRAFSQGRKLDTALLEPLRALAARLLPLLKASPNAFLMYFSRGTADDYLIAKHANVGVLAARLGLQMGLSDADILGIMLAGFVHDIGLSTLTRLDLEPRVLSEPEKASLRRHCAESAALFLGDIPEKALLLDVCQSHHERMDGSGYPKGLKGTAIPSAARLVAVAEVFEALTHPRPYRDRELSSEVMKKVIDQGGQHFDEAVVKALIRSLSIYPPGSYIELNNHTVARVIGVNPDLPTRPLLLPVYDASGHALATGDFLDLSSTPLVRILRAVDETTLQISDSREQMNLRSQRWWTV